MWGINATSRGSTDHSGSISNYFLYGWIGAMNCLRGLFVKIWGFWQPYKKSLEGSNHMILEVAFVIMVLYLHNLHRCSQSIWRSFEIPILADCWPNRPSRLLSLNVAESTLKEYRVCHKMVAICAAFALMATHFSNNALSFRNTAQSCDMPSFHN